MSKENPFPFITYAERSTKPRTSGMTMVIDKFLGVRQARDLCEVGAQYIDVLKMGWGTSGIIAEDVLRKKIEIYRHADLQVCPGGTFLEYAFDQDKVHAFLERAKDLGFSAIEVSNGIHPQMTVKDKQDIIRVANDMGFYTMSEVGKKFPEEDRLLGTKGRIEEIKGDLSAGSQKVVMESRESGTVGIFYENGKVNSQMAYEIFQSIDPDDIIWEAPQKEQQLWLIHQLGAEVNIGNVPHDEVLSLETLRLGLRADTLREHRKNAFKVYLELGIGGALRAQRRGDVVVVVDALRASTTIMQILAEGAAHVVPVVSAEELQGDITVAERGAVKLPFADYGNSPVELRGQPLKDKKVILSSTNGTECIRTSKSPDNHVLIGSVTNCSAVAKLATQLVQQSGRNLTLLAAGRNNLPAIEDRLGVTEILKRLESPIIRGILEPHYSDNFERDFLSSDSGVNLVTHGYADDVILCSKVDLYPFVPEFDGEKIVINKTLT